VFRKLLITISFAVQPMNDWDLRKYNAAGAISLNKIKTHFPMFELLSVAQGMKKTEYFLKIHKYI